jgi:peptidoglycan/xylan/chitin deacetylase (PgdA/CDA1 family)
MRRRWNWDFEDEQRAARMPELAPLDTPADASLISHRARVRRRRGGAALAMVGVLVVIVSLLLSSHGGSTPASRVPAKAAHAGVRQVDPPGESTVAGKEAVKDVLGYTPFVREGGGRGRDIALTFDDGPGPYTPELLSVLERFRVHATFFAIGQMERYFSASTAREIRDGDVVGDHTETHPEMALLSAREQHNELFEQMVRIELIGGTRPNLFRPPYGSFNATTTRELHSLHLLMVLWSIDTDDYQRPGVPAIVQSALAGAHPGAIILMHDGGGDRSQTIAALPTIIRKLRARGFHLVTVPQLLVDDPPPHGKPLPTNLSGD